MINVGNKKSVNISKVYGVRRNIKSSSSAWERIKDSVGLVANAQVGTTAVVNNFDSIYPWSDIITCNYNNTSKKIVAYYGDANFSFTGSNGQVLTIIPEFYYKRYVSDGYEYVLISKDNLDGFVKSDKFMIGRYTMSGSSSGVFSRSGYSPLVNTTIANFRQYAKNLGSGWQQLDWHYFILQMLYLVEYADYNAQSKLGAGFTNANNTGAIKSGGCDKLGMKSGSAAGNDTSSVIYRGVEDIFGNVWQFVDGININNYQAYVNNSTSGSYVTGLGYDPKHPLVALATDVGGSSSTYTTDYYWCANEKRIARVGGRWYESSQCGWFDFAFLSLSSDAGDQIGARLLNLIRDLVCTFRCFPFSRSCRRWLRQCS